MKRRDHVIPSRRAVIGNYCMVDGRSSETSTMAWFVLVSIAICIPRVMHQPCSSSMILQSDVYEARSEPSSRRRENDHEWVERVQCGKDSVAPAIQQSVFRQYYTVGILDQGSWYCSGDGVMRKNRDACLVLYLYCTSCASISMEITYL